MKKRLLKTFLELIKINETSGQEKEIVDYVKKYLQKLDLKIKSDKFGNIIAQLPGVGKPLLLNTHLDIPEPMKNFDYKIKEDVILANGKSILGADPKSGLTVLLEFVRYIKDRKITTRPLEFVFTKSEEKGLVGAKNLDFSLLTAKEGLVLDENGPCTQVVVKAPSFCRVLIKITGKTAHVSEPEKGINALEIACNAISGLDLGYIRKGVTFNIGLLNSGTAANTVPGFVDMEADLRSFDEKKLTKSLVILKNRLQKETIKLKGKLKFDIYFGYYGYELDQNNKLIKQLTTTYQKMALKPNFFSTYGGSDANVFNKSGITCVPVGSGYYNAHQYNEYINLRDMENLLYFLVEFARS